MATVASPQEHLKSIPSPHPILTALIISLLAPELVASSLNCGQGAPHKLLPQANQNTIYKQS